MPFTMMFSPVPNWATWAGILKVITNLIKSIQIDQFLIFLTILLCEVILLFFNLFAIKDPYCQFDLI